MKEARGRFVRRLTKIIIRRLAEKGNLLFFRRGLSARKGIVEWGRGYSTGSRIDIFSTNSGLIVDKIRMIW